MVCFLFDCLFFRNQNPDGKEMILYPKLHGSVILFYGITDAFDSKAMVFCILFCRDRKSVSDRHILVAIIPDFRIYKLFSRRYLHVNDSFLRIRDQEYMLYCIVQRISEDGADVRHMHKFQKASVCHAGKFYLILASAAFSRPALRPVPDFLSVSPVDMPQALPPFDRSRENVFADPVLP